MSTLGKIITVLNVVAAIVVGSLVVSYAYFYENTKNNADKANVALREAVQANRSLRNAVAARNTDLQTKESVQLSQVNALNQTIAGLRDAAAADARKLGEQQAELAKLNNTMAGIDQSFKAVNEEKTRLQSEQAKAVTTANELTKANQGLKMQVQNLTSENDDMRARLRQNEQDLAEAKKKISFMQQNGATVTTSVPVLPSVDLKGIVKDVDMSKKVVEINLGSADHVVAGMTFVVSHESQYVGDLKITTVDENSAVGRLETVNGEVRRNDNVTYRVRN